MLPIAKGNGFETGYAISLSGCSWSLLRAQFLRYWSICNRNEPFPLDTVYSQFEDWPAGDRSIIFSHLEMFVKSLENNYHSFIKTVKNPILKQFYHNQLGILKDFRSTYIDKQIMAEI